MSERSPSATYHLHRIRVYRLLLQAPRSRGLPGRLFDFSGRSPETYVDWAKYHTGATDEGNGVTFRFTYNHLEGKSNENITFDDVYIDPDAKHGDFETLGDFNEVVKRFNEYKYSVTGSDEAKSASREKHYVAYDRTNGLPEWYYDYYFNE